MEIRDRRGGFLWVPNKIFDHFAKSLNSTTFMLYLALCRLANNDTQTCYPSQDKLGEMIGISERTVRTAMDELESMNLIAVEKTGRGYQYTLTIPENFAGVEAQDTGSPLPVTPEADCRSYRKQTSGDPPSLPYRNKTYKNKTQEQDFKLAPPSSEKPFHQEAKKVILQCYRYLNKTESPWDGSEAKQLKDLIRAKPDLTLGQLRQALWNYAQSEINPSDRPRVFIPKLFKYLNGPIDRFGMPKNATVPVVESLSITERLQAQLGRSP
jgi:biotin operon repressor